MGLPDHEGEILTVHEYVDEEDLHCVQGITEAEKGAERNEGESRNCSAELESEEVLNVIEDRLA